MNNAWVSPSLAYPTVHQSTFTTDHPIITYLILAYIILSGLLILRFVRAPIIGWYKSQGWIIAGSGPIDILFKQIGYRITLEAFSFGVACVVGSLGGNIFAIMRARSLRNA